MQQDEGVVKKMQIYKLEPKKNDLEKKLRFNFHPFYP